MKSTFGFNSYSLFKRVNHELLIENDKNLLIEFPIHSNFCNIHGTLHGGMTSTIIDNATTVALLKKDIRATVSVNLSV